MLVVVSRRDVPLRRWGGWCPGRPSSRWATVGLLAALIGLGACSGLGPSSGPRAAARSPAPFAGAPLAATADSPARRQVAQWRAAGETAKADALDRLARGPTAIWLDGRHSDVTAEVAQRTQQAEVEAAWPVLVLYNIPQRDCGHYSGGGVGTEQEYLSWLGRLAAGLGDRPAIVVLEPDAVAQATTGCAGLDPAARFRTLSTAVDILTAQTRAQVYLDAGHSGWVTDLDELARNLRASGIAKTAGFALNVSNFQTTEASVAYGDDLSARIGDKPYLIDVGRNGAGPPPSELEESWCNPPDRRIGVDPTTSPELGRVDALLWVKEPGSSDGPCRGAPAAGEWSADLALGLVGWTG